jgi:small ligand-binding sensory domain FIST
MPKFSISSTSRLDADGAAAEIAAEAEAQLGGADGIAGGLLLATAAAGAQGPEVGQLLANRWSEADLVGTSFEGLLFEGRVWRDEPAMALLSWGVGDHEPLAWALDPNLRGLEEISDGILSASGVNALDASDLLLLFPDAHGPPSVDSLLPELAARMGAPAIAGAAASGVDGASALAWAAGRSTAPGGWIGVLVPGSAKAPAATGRVQTATATRLASDWLEVSSSRGRWIERLDGVPALERLRGEMGLTARDSLEPHLGRLLVRVRRAAREATEDSRERHDEERFIVGIDDRRGAFSIPTEVYRGDEIAVAWPDAALAREGLRSALEVLDSSPWLLQFMCRARDAALHGDDDLESAWVSNLALGRQVLGTVAPFQLGPGPGSSRAPQLLVHSSVLAALD